MKVFLFKKKKYMKVFNFLWISVVLMITKKCLVLVMFHF